MSRETTFQSDVRQWQVIAKTLVDLTRDVVQDLKGRGYQGKTVTVKVRFSDFKTYTRASTLPEGTDSFEVIKGAAFECLGRVELKRRVRLVGVRVGNLEKIGDSKS